MRKALLLHPGEQQVEGSWDLLCPCTDARWNLGPGSSGCIFPLCQHPMDCQDGEVLADHLGEMPFSLIYDPLRHRVSEGILLSQFAEKSFVAAENMLEL